MLTLLLWFNIHSSKSLAAFPYEQRLSAREDSPKLKQLEKQSNRFNWFASSFMCLYGCRDLQVAISNLWLPNLCKQRSCLNFRETLDSHHTVMITWIALSFEKVGLNPMDSIFIRVKFTLCSFKNIHRTFIAMNMQRATSTKTYKSLKIWDSKNEQN